MGTATFTNQSRAFLAIDSADALHVAYSQSGGGRYAVRAPGGSWQTETLAFTPYGLAVDPQARPIFLSAPSATQLEVVLREGPGVFTPFALPVGSFGIAHRIMAPADGTWHVFHDVGRHAWRVAP